MPGAWVSSVAASLPSVDVDSLPFYSRLIEDSVILQPALLQLPPQDAAATLWVLERSTRSSAVWYGAAVVSLVMLQYPPASLQMYLDQLLQVWLELGQVPFTFGQLWLEAPEALLRWGLTHDPANEFRKHLELLQMQLQAGPIAEILLASTSLSGCLLSLMQPEAALSGSVHRAAGYLLIAPGVQDLCVLRETLPADGIDSSASESDRAVLAVYGGIPVPKRVQENY
eukprot:gene8534-8716_t